MYNVAYVLFTLLFIIMKKLLLVFNLLLTLSAFAQMPTQGLIGYWPFNGNSLDESGNGHHAINAGKSKVNYTTDRFGVVNAAYSADTTYLKIPYSQAFDFKSGDKFSISFWVYYPDDFGYYGEIFTKGKPGIEPGPSEGIYGITFYDSPNYVVRPSGIFGNVKFEKDKWYHFIYLYDGDSTSIFINKLLDLRTKANVSQSNYDMTVGRMSTFRGNGKVDDIAMYNRAITTDEISKLYNITATAVDEITAVNNLVQISADNFGNYVIISKAEIENIKVYNIKGSLIKETTNRNIGKLSAGIYIFHIDTKEGVVKSKLLVK